jgi:tight adherence protein B
MGSLQGSPWLAALVAFGAIFLAVIAVVLLIEAARRWRSQRVISRELRRLSESPGTPSVDSGLVREREGVEIAWLEPVLLRLPRRQDLQHFLEQADMGWSVSTFIMITIGLAAGFALAVLVAVGGGPAPLGGVALGVMLPYLVVTQRRKKRFAKFEEHFPEAIDLLSRAIRAGHAFSTGLRVVSEESPDPISAEFRQVYEEQKFGLPLSESLLALSDRISLLDVRIFVTAVLVQLESGGNLAEILDNLAYIIRERFRFRRQLNTHTAHGRITGLVLVLAPIVAGVGMYSINPEYMMVLFTEPLGRLMLFTAAGFQILGFIVIRRIMDVEV